MIFVFKFVIIFVLSHYREYGWVQTGPVQWGSSAGTHAVAPQENQGKDVAEKLFIFELYLLTVKSKYYI